MDLYIKDKYKLNIICNVHVDHNVLVNHLYNYPVLPRSHFFFSTVGFLAAW